VLKNDLPGMAASSVAPLNSRRTQTVSELLTQTTRTVTALGRRPTSVFRSPGMHISRSFCVSRTLVRLGFLANADPDQHLLQIAYARAIPPERHRGLAQLSIEEQNRLNCCTWPLCKG